MERFVYIPSKIIHETGRDEDEIRGKVWEKLKQHYCGSDLRVFKNALCVDDPDPSPTSHSILLVDKVYCRKCTWSGGIPVPIYHEPPVCGEEVEDG